MKQLVSQIPWGQIIRIIQTSKDPSERQWYINKIIEHGWSRPVLVHQIESGGFTSPKVALIETGFLGE